MVWNEICVVCLCDLLFWWFVFCCLHHHPWIAAGLNTLEVVPVSVILLLCAWDGGLYPASIIMSNVHEQWSPAVSVGHKHRKWECWHFWFHWLEGPPRYKYCSPLCWWLCCTGTSYIYLINMTGMIFQQVGWIVGWIMKIFVIYLQSCIVHQTSKQIRFRQYGENILSIQ